MGFVNVPENLNIQSDVTMTPLMYVHQVTSSMTLVVCYFNISSPWTHDEGSSQGHWFALLQNRISASRSEDCYSLKKPWMRPSQISIPWICSPFRFPFFFKSCTMCNIHCIEFLFLENVARLDFQVFFKSCTMCNIHCIEFYIYNNFCSAVNHFVAWVWFWPNISG